MRRLSLMPWLALLVMVTSCGQPQVTTVQLDRLGARPLTQPLSFFSSRNGASLTAQVSSGAPVAQIYAGDLEIHGTEVLWSRGDEKVSVGHINDHGTMELCADAGLDSCEASISRMPTDIPGEDPVIGLHLDWRTTWDSSGHDSAETSLVDFVLPAPNQEEGGTCLFMATTGTVELLLNQRLQRHHSEALLDGPTDISERFLINASYNHSARNWRTDTGYLFNKEGGALLNRTYRYTKGWSRQDDGQWVRATPGEPGAIFGTEYNWIDDYSASLQQKLVEIPTLERDLLFVDPEHNQWNVGIMDESVITAIKRKLLQKRPVTFIYNHYGYWHAAIIVGFDDNAPTNGCPFVDEFNRSMLSQNPKLVNKVKAAMAAQGGCRSRGVFYVRDSIYEGTAEPEYDYIPGHVGEERPYSKRIVKHSYDWAKYLGNHAYAWRFVD